MRAAATEEAETDEPRTGAAETETGGAPGATAQGVPYGRALRWSLGAVAAALVVLATWQPVWHADLSAPQYPQGLELDVYGDRVEGDIREINALNHYVGMKAFSIEDVPEIVLWYPAIGIALVAVAIGTLLRREHWLSRLARLGVWLVPLGVLVDIQYRLYEYGKSMDPAAPIRLDNFIPKVVGTTKVVNFTTHARPGLAVVLMLFAAFLLTFGPRLVRRGRAALAAWLRKRGSEEAAAAADS